MAELDDFFAKKDKKKSKNKTKFVTADEMVKNLEDGTKREVVKPKKPEVAAGVAVVGENENSGTKVPESAPVSPNLSLVKSAPVGHLGHVYKFIVLPLRSPSRRNGRSSRRSSARTTVA